MDFQELCHLVCKSELDWQSNQPTEVPPRSWIEWLCSWDDVVLSDNN